MNNQLTTTSASDVERVLLSGDLSTLTAPQKISYYNQVCHTLGLNPLTKPFEYMKLNGKEVLYATKGCAEQLRFVHKVSIKVVSREILEDLSIVTAEATDQTGRCDSAIGAVSIAGLKGEARANALMKAETKAKRRATLSICGLNMLDEDETAAALSEDQKRQQTIKPEQPTELDGIVDNSVWKFEVGKFRGRTLEQVYNDPTQGPEMLKGYVDYLEGQSYKKNEPLSPKAQEMVNHIADFLGAMENEIASIDVSPAQQILNNIREPGQEG